MVQGAVYGDLDVSKEQREKAEQLKDETLHCILKKKSLLRKIKMWLVDFVY